MKDIKFFSVTKRKYQVTLYSYTKILWNFRDVFFLTFTIDSLVLRIT